MPTPTIFLLLESRLQTTARPIMGILRPRHLHPRHGIVVWSTILLTTVPTPCTTTPRPQVKRPLGIQATGEHIRTCRILETPTLAPRAHLGIVRSHTSFNIHAKIARQWPLTSRNMPDIRLPTIPQAVYSGALGLKRRRIYRLAVLSKLLPPLSDFAKLLRGIA